MVIVGMGHFSEFFVSRVLTWIFVVFEVPPRYAGRPFRCRRQDLARWTTF